MHISFFVSLVNSFVFSCPIFTKQQSRQFLRAWLPNCKTKLQIVIFSAHDDDQRLNDLGQFLGKSVVLIADKTSKTFHRNMESLNIFPGIPHN